MTLSLVLPVEAIAVEVADELERRRAARDDAAGELARTAGDRMTLSKAEAAEALGISVDHLDRHVMPDLRVVRTGRLVLIPVSELTTWISETSHVLPSLKTGHAATVRLDVTAPTLRCLVDTLLLRESVQEMVDQLEQGGASNHAWSAS